MFAASKTAAAAAGTPPASTDPQFNYVTLLLNDTGTNGQQNNTFLDSSTNNFTITRNGTPTQGSVTPYWPDGQWSNFFNGTNQSLNTASNSAFAFGTGNFTVEAWVYTTKAINAEEAVFDLGAVISAGSFAIFRGANGAAGTWFIRMDGTGNDLSTSVLSSTLNSWTHLAVCKSGSTVTFYINGVAAVSGSRPSINITQSTPYIGQLNSFGYWWGGNISNLRVVKGTALYTSNFTPSTTPLTAVSGTSLLTCQSNRFKDNSSNNFAITVTGAPTVQAFDPFSPAASYGVSNGGSGYFDGASDYVQAANDTAFNLTSGDWTLDGWFYALAWKSGDTWIFGKDGQSGVTYQQYCVHVNSSRRLVGAIGSGASGAGEQKVIGTSTVPLNTWNYYRFVKSGTTLYLFLNGVLETSATQTFTMTHGTYPLRVGGQNNTTNCDWNGYLSDIRIIKGTALSTSTFTPPTSPVTAITGTSLLLNFTNAGIYDAATLNDLVTVGDAKVSTAQAKFGSSSMYFDGTGDYLSTPTSQNMYFGTGDFTVEAWVYPTALSSDWFISSASGSGGFFFGFSSTTIVGYGWGRAGVAWDYRVASTATANTWQHVAVTRSGTSMRLFVNGVQQGTTQTISTAYNMGTTSTTIGSQGANYYLNGYLDDLRVTKGYARYTANFTPPTAPFPTR